MRKALMVLGLIAVGLVALVISIAFFSRIAGVFGLGPVALVALAAGLGAAWTGHTSESRAIAEDFIAALAEIGMPRKAAAELLGVSESLLNRQLAGYDMLASPYRLARLGSRFREAFYRRAVEREQRGMYLANAMLIDILHNVRVLTGEQLVASVGDRRVA